MPTHLSGGEGIVGVKPHLCRQIEGDVQRVLAMVDQEAEALIGCPRGCKPRVLAHRPGAVAVHVAVNTPREGILARLTDQFLVVDIGDILRPVDRLHLDP